MMIFYMTMMFAAALVQDANDLQNKLNTDGLLFHGIDFLPKAVSLQNIVDHWNKGQGYMDSFTYVNSLGVHQQHGIAGDIGIVIDPTHADVTVHMMAPDNMGWKPFKPVHPDNQNS